MTDQQPTQPSSRRKGIALAAGGAVLAAAAVGGIWGYNAFFGQGDQPAQALPAKGLLGYMSLDLSPNGEQLLEARETLNAFPGLRKELDLGGKEDLRKLVFEKIQNSGDCKSLNYDKDVEPWLGDRIAGGFLDAGKAKEPDPVLVLQTTDQDKAETSLPALKKCLDEDSRPNERTSHAFSGEWLVLMPGKGKAERAAEAAAEQSLADDDDFRHWTGEAGDPGIVTAYATPLFFTRLVEDVTSDDDELAAELEGLTEDFKGAGVVARFNGGGVELEVATDGETAGVEGFAPGGAVMGSLPDSTVAALGLGFADGWVDTLLEENGPSLEDASGMTINRIEAELKAAAGIDFDDIETLLGDGAALALDSGLDSELFAAQDPTAIPVGLKIKGDTAEIEGVIEKIRNRLAEEGMPRGFLVSRAIGDYVVVTMNSEYAELLEDESGLGQTARFRSLLPDAEDSMSSLFIDFDAGNWLDGLLEDFGAPKDVRANVAPLSGFGITTWSDGDVAHSLVKITTAPAGKKA